MIGQEGVCRALVQRLNECLPTECALVAQNSGLRNVFPVPRPENVYPYWTDLLDSLDKLPAIMVMIEDTDTITAARTADLEAEEDQYAHQYPVVVAILNTGAHYGETELHRQRLMLAVRNLLLRSPLLIPGESDTARIDTDTLKESPTFGAQNQETAQWLLESALRVTVRTYETLEVLDKGPRVNLTHQERLIDDE